MLEDHLGKPVGFVQINRPIHHTDRSFECATWWEEHESETGVFPIKLGHLDGLYPERKEYYLHASIPAKVVDDYFPALWCGMPVSNKPTKAKHIGEPRIIKVGSDIVKAIEMTGNIPVKHPMNDVEAHYRIHGGRDCIDWFVNPEVWSAVIAHWEWHLRKAYEDMPHWWNEYQAGEDEFHSRVGMVAYFGERIAKYAREIEKIHRYQGYYMKGTANWHANFLTNTEWTKT